MADDPYLRNKPVSIPGLRPGVGQKRQRVHGTSYHDAVINLACELYRRLAMIGLEYWETDLRPYCNDNSFQYSEEPEFRDFPAEPWPEELARLVMDEARIADPILKTERINAELSSEVHRADLRLVSTIIAFNTS